MLPVHAHLGAKEQLTKENEELKQNKEELEVRMNALKSQYEGRLLRLDRELREMKEPQEQSGAKVCSQSEAAEHRNALDRSKVLEHPNSSSLLLI